MRKYFGIFLLTISLSQIGCTPSSQKSNSLAQVLSNGKWIDLTYSFSDSTLYWPNNKITFHLDTFFRGMTDSGFFYSAYTLCAPEHGGTHLDAPIHFAEHGWTSDEIPVDNLSGNAVVIDISEKAQKNRDYLVSIEDFEAWEKEHGKIPDGSIVLLRTGYGNFYPDAAKYFGTAEHGAAAIPFLHFPGLDPAAAGWLVKNRKIKAIGLDTPSIDYGQSKTFRSHQVLLGENILVFENIAHLNLLPATGAFVVALPMKIKGGSGGPLRIVAWMPNEK
jgi:kynurenine formamidase